MTSTPQRVAPDIDEETLASAPGRPGNPQAIWRRFSSLGVIVVLVGSLVLLLKDVLPTEVLERLAEIASDPLKQLTPDDESSSWQEAIPRELSPDGEGSLPTPIELPEVSKQILSVNFSPDSDILEPDNWYVLDSAVVMLSEQPESIALIAGFSRALQSGLYNPELSRARAAAVERYLLDAGVDRDRLYVEERAAPDDSAENSLSHLKVAEKMNRIVHINLHSKSSQ